VALAQADHKAAAGEPIFIQNHADALGVETFVAGFWLELDPKNRVATNAHPTLKVSALNELIFTHSVKFGALVTKSKSVQTKSLEILCYSRALVVQLDLYGRVRTAIVGNPHENTLFWFFLHLVCTFDFDKTFKYHTNNNFKFNFIKIYNKSNKYHMSTAIALLGIENKLFQLLSVIAEFYLGKALYC
jgi:hypothetical protein